MRFHQGHFVLALCILGAGGGLIATGVTANILPSTQEGPFTATVVRVADGDTITVDIPAWQDTPFRRMGLRVAGIDTPESARRYAQCDFEVQRGLAATAYARTLAQPGDTVTFVFLNHDKYGGRIDVNVRLADGRDWGQTLINNGYALPYDGGTKPSWCSN